MKYLYFLIPLSFWSVLIFINITMTFHNKYLDIMLAFHGKYFEYGQMPIKFPFICAVLHMSFGCLIAFLLIRTIRLKQQVVLALLILLLFVATLVFLNYTFFNHLMYVS